MSSAHSSSADLFRLEALEDRILMSGDAVTQLMPEDVGESGDDLATAFDVVAHEALDFETEDTTGSSASAFELDFDLLDDFESESDQAVHADEPETISSRAFIPLQEPPPPPAELTLFEYQPDSGKGLDATLKVDGVDLILTDNLTQSELKRQKLDTISDVIITGSSLDDHLTVLRGDSPTWLSKLSFNAGSQLDGGEDTLNLIGTLKIQGSYLPSTSGGSGKWNLVDAEAIQQATLTFSGLESATVEGLDSLRFVTQGSSDRISLTSPTAFSSVISGTSDQSALVPLTFTKIETLVLDLALNDKETSSVVSVVNKIPGVSSLTGSHTHSPNDQVSIVTTPNGALNAAQLKHVSILTGKGKDALILSGGNLSLHQPGGTFEFNAGEGSDSVFSDPEAVSGQVDANGNGTLSQGGSSLSLKSAELLRSNPVIPVVLVPDFMGSFATNGNIGNWFANIGIHPDQLEAQPLTEDYRDMIATLENNGYRLGQSLFVANWDWRLPLAPVDGSLDGVINGLTGTSISDEVFQFGIDYFGYALRSSLSGWASVHGGVKPASVDVIGFGAGGLLARAYLQSPAYGGVASGGGVLPKIQNLSLVSTPNRGQVDAWSLLHDDWSASLDVRFTGLAMNMAYERIVAGGNVTTPGGAIRLEDITQDGTRLGTPSTTKFLARYLPSLRDLLPTFAFLDDGLGNVQSINSDPLQRNNFLLDLNDGLDFSYGVDQFPLTRQPNRFVEPVQGKVQVFYSDSASTPVKSVVQNGGSGIIWTLNSVIGRSPADNETWYKSSSVDSAGDKVVTTESAIGQFGQDSRFGSKITAKKITEFDAGSGATHAKMFYNAVVRKGVLEFFGRTVLDSDLSSHGGKNVVKKVLYVAQVGVSSLIQERQSGQETFGGRALISIFQNLFTGLGELALEYLGTNPEDPDGGPTEDVIDFGTASYGLIPLPLKIVTIDGTSLEFQDFKFNKTSKTFSGKVGLGADSIILFPSSKDARLTGTYVTGLLEFKDNVFQSFELTIGELRAQFKDFLTLGGRNIKISPFDDIIFSAGELFGGIPKFKLEGKVLGLQITNKAEFLVSGFEVTVKDGIFHTLNLGKFLPFDLTGLAIRFHGDANKNGFIDPGERFELTAFDLTVKGKMSQAFWSSFPFTPVVQVGPQNAASPGDELTMTLSVANGTVTPKDIGPITLGFKDLKIGQVTLGATVTLGGYQNSVFIPDFGGFLKIESGLKDLTGAAQVEITGDFTPDLGRLDISGKLSVGFSLKNGLIKVGDAVLDFGMVIEKVDLAGGGFRFDIKAPAGQLFFLNKLQVGLLQVKLGNLLTFQSRNTVLDFNATGRDPLVQFGGTAQTQSPELVFDPNSVPNGSLGAVFGTAAGPIQGWGGAVGNFAIGADLSFQLLQGFFVQIKVGPNAKFGMPSFIPVELRAVTLQFNDDAIQNGELVDPGNFTLIFSGGVKETAKWPLFGQFSGLRVNVQKLVAGDLINAIENLNGFAIGLKNVKLGPVTLSGSLALGVVSVQLPNEQGQSEVKSAFYARLQGAVYYSGLGGGIDIVFSEYGPLLSTLSLSGLVIPKIGLVFGFRDAGFVFGGDPLPSISDPRELLTNPVFHSPTAITLAEIEKRVQTSIIKAQPTWNSAFTLTGTGTVTSIYVQGMVTGEVTVAANIGLQGPNAGLKLLATGQLNVLGFEMGGGAMLLDFSNPLVPQFDMAFALPSPGNPIGFLFPSQGVILGSLDTKGIIEMPIIGLGVFFQKFAEGTLANVQDLMEQALIRIAADLESDHGQLLSQLLLDLNSDGTLSEPENARTITAEFVGQRVIGDSAAGIEGLLVTNFNALQSLSPEALAARLLKGDALIQELIPLLLRHFQDIASASITDVVGELGSIIQDAAIAGLAAGWKSFDPTFSLTGLIQPILFGMPLGAPNVEVTIVINKDQLTFGFNGSLASALLSGNNLPPGLLGDSTQFAVSLDLPDELISAMITNLVDNGAGDVKSLTELLIDSINPFSGWEVLFSTTLNFLGFKTGAYSGIVFGPQSKNDKGEYEPKGTFGEYVVNLDPDGDSVPNQDLLDGIANGPPNRIPVNTLAQYENMLKNGGVALTGQMFIPDLLRNPIETITSIDWTLPTVQFDPAHPFQNITTLSDDVSAVSKYVTDIFEGLTSQSEWERLQVYLPSPANLFHMGDYLDPLTQGVIQPIDLNILSPEKLAEIEALIKTAYIEGYGKPEFLGIEFGNTFIKGSVDQLTVQTEIPWLAGFESKFEVKRKNMRPQDLLFELATSSLAKLGLSTIGVDNPAEAFAFLKHDALSDLPEVSIPVAVLEATLTTDKLGEWLGDNFGLPAETFQVVSDVASHEVFFGAYSPGFGEVGDSAIKRQGGFVLDARMRIAGFVEEAHFHFEMLPFSFGSGTNLATFFIPQFHAHAEVPSLTIPGLSSNPALVDIKDAVLDIERNAEKMTLSVNAHMSLLGDSAVVDLHGGFQIVSEGLFGELALTVNGDSGLAFPNASVRFDGATYLRVNTTDQEQQGIAAQTTYFISSGSLVIQVVNVDTFRLEGNFEWASSDQAFHVRADAQLNAGPLGKFGVVGGLNLSGDGLVGGLQLGPVELDLPLAHLSGEFQLVVNTTSVTQLIEAFEVNPDTGQVSELTQIEVQPLIVRLDMGGAFRFADFASLGYFSFHLSPDGLLIESDAQLQLVVGGATILGLRQRGGLRLDASGFYGAIGLDWAFDPPDIPGLDIPLDASNVFRLEVNDSQQARVVGGQSLPAGPYARVIYEGELNLLGLELAGKFLWKEGAIEKVTPADNPAPEVLADPGSGIVIFRNQGPGTVLYFQVTGDADAGRIWGSNIYTDDSPLSKTVVHSGVLADGESGVVKITLVEGQSAYQGTSQNGVSSLAFGNWVGSYTVESYDMSVHEPMVTRESILQIEADAGLALRVGESTLFGFDVRGGLIVRSGHQVSSVGVTASLDLALISDAHASFGLPLQIDPTSFHLSVNTLQEEVELAGNVLAAGPYAKVMASGTADLAGLHFGGNFHFQANQQHLELGLLGALSLRLVDEEVLRFGVESGLRLNGDGLSGLVDVALKSGGSFNAYGIGFKAGSEEQFRLELNLTDVPQAFDVSILPAGPYAKVVYQGGLELSGLEVDGQFQFQVGKLERAGGAGLSQRILPDPGATILNYRFLGVGTSLFFNVTGDARTGGVWGTDVYTDDSQLSKAAVHAGVLADGEMGIVRVTLVDGQSSYAGTSRGGVSSASFGAWAGSYSIEKVITSSVAEFTSYRNFNVGQDLFLQVTGDSDAGPIWGTNVYTDDSRLSAAVVHAGVLKDGETGLVKVTLLGGQNQYIQSQRNGILSNSYGVWHRSYSVTSAIPVQSGQVVDAIQVEAAAELNLNVGDVQLMKFAINGGFALIHERGEGAGMVGQVELDVLGDATDSLGLGLSVANRFRLELNTTNAPQVLGENRLMAGPYASVAFEGSATVGSLQWSGQFRFEVREGLLKLGATASLNLLQETWQFSGSLGFSTNGVAVSGKLSGSGVSNVLVNVRGDFTLEMNTSQSELLGIAANTLRIVVRNATISVVGLRLSGSAVLEISGDAFSVEVSERDPLTLSLLNNTLNVSVSGHIRPGDIALNGSTSVSFGNKSSIHLGGTLNVSINQSGMTGSMNLGLTVWGNYLASTQVNLAVSDARLTFNIQTAIQVFHYARYDGSVAITIDKGFVSASLSGTLRLWNTFNVSVAGSIASNGLYSLSGTSWMRLGTDFIGAGFTFSATINNQGVYLSAGGSVWALGITASLNATVGSDGRFKGAVTVLGFTVYLNFSLNNGLQVWLSEVGDSDIYFTSNLDGTPDASGVTTKAGADGTLDFTSDWELLEVDELEALFHQVLDKNGDGRLDSDAGTIRIIGGQHWDTGEIHEGISTVTDRLLSGDSDWALATVFIDFNGNDLPDEGEPSVEADEYGFYDFWAILYPDDELGGGSGLGLLEPFDLDGSGVIEDNEGRLVLTGGTDYFTDEENPDVIVFDEVLPYAETDWVDAFVFLDVNGNLEWDEDEVGVYTDEFGFWDFDPFEGELESDPERELLDLIDYDLNEDGILSEDEGVLILQGGRQLESGDINTETFTLEETLGYGWVDFIEAEIFFDANLNGERDADEPFVQSDEDGYFEFFTYDPEVLLLDLLPFDLNGNGSIDSEEGALVLVEGFELGSGEANANSVLLDTSIGFGETSFREARVFLDLNGNRLWDANEISAFTDNTGFFWFYSPSVEEAQEWLGDLTRFDLNGDGLLSLNEGALILVGGTHLETGLPNTSVITIEDPYGFDNTDYAGATVFFDVNKNGILDSEELAVLTDEYGYYQFITYSDEELQLYLGRLTPFDLNRDGALSSDEGQMVVVGGRHLLTGVVNEGQVVLDEIVLSGFTLYQGATSIFFDANKNLVLDDNEISVLPDDNNFFSFFEFDSSQFGLSNLGNLGRYDTNHNGRLDPAEGIFVIQRGVDQQTGLENPLFVRALGSDFGSGVESSISPLSNIKVSMVNWWNISPQESDRLIAAAFGLPSFLVINNVNPLANPNDPLNEELLAAGTMLSSMMLDMASALQAANPTLSAIQSQSAVADSIADAILVRILDRLESADALNDLSQDENGFYHGLIDALQSLDGGLGSVSLSGFSTDGRFIDFSNKDTLVEILSDAVYWTDSVLSDDVIEAVSIVVAEKIRRLQELASWNLKDPVLYFAPFKAVTQLVSAPAIAELVESGQGAEALIDSLTGEGLLNALAAHSPADTVPLLSNLADQEVYPGDVIVLPVTIWDVDKNVNELEFTLSTSHGAVVPLSAIRILGDGLDRFLEIKMSEFVKEGQSRVTLTVSDGTHQVRRSMNVLLLPHAVDWQSIALHGDSRQEFSLEVSVDGSFTESRLTGLHLLEIAFNEPLNPASIQSSSLSLGASMLDAAANVSDWSALNVTAVWASDARSVRLLFQTPLQDTGRYQIRWSGLETVQGREVVKGMDRVFSIMPGDVNGDHRVNNLDLGAVRSFGYVYPGEMDLSREIASDFNTDGKVDLLDEQYILDHRGVDARSLSVPRVLYHVPISDSQSVHLPLSVFGWGRPDPVAYWGEAVYSSQTFRPAMVSGYGGSVPWTHGSHAMDASWSRFNFDPRRKLL